MRPHVPALNYRIPALKAVEAVKSQRLLLQKRTLAKQIHRAFGDGRTRQDASILGCLTYLNQVFRSLGTLVFDRRAFIQNRDAVGVELYKPLRRYRTLGSAESLCVHHQDVQEPRLTLLRISNLLYRLTELFGEVGLPFNKLYLNALWQMRGYFFLYPVVENALRCNHQSCVNLRCLIQRTHRVDSNL